MRHLIIYRCSSLLGFCKCPMTSKDSFLEEASRPGYQRLKLTRNQCRCFENGGVACSDFSVGMSVFLGEWV